MGGYSDAEIGYSMTRSRLSQMKGDLEQAHQEIQKAVDLMQRNAPTWVREEVISQQIRVALARHRLADAETALAQMGPPLGAKISDNAGGEGQGLSAIEQVLNNCGPDAFPLKISPALGIKYNSALRILLYRAQTLADLTSLPRGMALADQLLHSALQGEYIQTALETLLLRAQMKAALGESVASLADYASAVELAEPEGTISIFMEEGRAAEVALRALLKSRAFDSSRASYVESILAAFSRCQPQNAGGEELAEAKPPASLQPGAKNGSENLVEPLTERETEVLRLIAEGLKYEEIAGRLFISLNTVRTYVKGIYSKLNVNNRSRAIALAHQYHLI